MYAKARVQYSAAHRGQPSKHVASSPNGRGHKPPAHRVSKRMMSLRQPAFTCGQTTDHTVGMSCPTDYYTLTVEKYAWYKTSSLLYPAASWPRLQPVAYSSGTARCQPASLEYYSLNFRSWQYAMTEYVCASVWMQNERSENAVANAPKVGCTNVPRR